MTFTAAPALLNPGGAGWTAQLTVALLLGAVYLAFWLTVPQRWSTALAISTIPLAIAASALPGPPVSYALGQLWIYPALALGFAAADSMTLGVVLVVVALALLASLATPSATVGLQAKGIPYVEVLVGIGALIAASARRLLSANEKVSLAQQQLAAAAVQEERSRFARDLHDLLGHSLTVLVAKLRLARRLPPAERDAELSDAERIAVRALDEVRQAVEGYRTPTLDSQIAGARAALAAAGIDVAVSGGANPVAAEAEGALAITVREAVTNVIRHSGAGHCSVTIGREDGTAWVEVRDDGHTAGIGTPSGLAGLQERVTQLGGTAVWGPASGGGFRVRVSVPAEPANGGPAQP